MKNFKSTRHSANKRLKNNLNIPEQKPTSNKKTDELTRNISGSPTSSSPSEAGIYYRIVEEALKNQSRPSKYVAVQVPITGEELPSGANKVKVWVSDLMTIEPGKDSFSSTMLVIQISGGCVHDVWACATTVPYCEQRFDSLTNKKFMVLVWDIGARLGFDAKFEVPTLLLAGNLFMRDPEATHLDIFQEEISVMSMTESMCMPSWYTLQDVVTPPEKRKRDGDEENRQGDWPEEPESSTRH